MQGLEGDATVLAKVIGAAAISMIAYGAYAKLGGGPVASRFGGSSFIVENKRYKFDYAIGGSSSFGGVLIAKGRQQGVSQGGATASIHYFDEAGAAAFVRTQKPGQCSAAFYNEYARHKLLIPATPAVETQLAALTFDDHDDTSSWRRFNLQGYCISRANSITIDGKPAAGPSNMFDNCMTMVATAIDVKPQPLPQFVARR
jgi:hypothetical protein